MPAEADSAPQQPRAVLVVNPSAAKGRAGRVAASVANRLRDSGVEVDEVVGRDGSDALDRARAAVQGAAALVVLGGDGTVHLGVQVVAGTGVPLGIVPAGTGNDLANLLGLPEQPLAAADVVAGGLRAHPAVGARGASGAAGAAGAAGGLRTIDAVQAAGKWFVGVLGCGFDSMVNERANRMSWPRGRQRYNLAILAELRVFRPLRFTLTLDGERWDTEAMLVAVGNGQSYGGGMRICPDADPADGLLDVTVVGPMRISRFLRLFPRVYNGTHVERPEVAVRRARSVTVESDGVVGYADGERFAALPLTCRVVPGALRVFVPPPPVKA